MIALRRNSPVFFALGAALVLAGLSGCGERADVRSVVIVTLDTTRADALGCYGGPPNLTPAIDALAQESVLYERAYTTAPLTLPAHASMMTGLYPIRHAARDNSRNPLPQAARTLAELAGRAGLETAAVVASAVLDPAQGIAQGFEHYDRVARPSESTTSVHFAERDADTVLERVRAWLDGRESDDPFFLWVHFFDPHFPYDPPPKYLMRASGIDYHGEVAYVDRAVGDLVGELRRRELLDDTLVVLTSDHGEGLGQHGETSHGTLCYDSTLRVPLLIRYPDGSRAGERADEVVSVVDVFPTVCEAAGLAVPSSLDGTSLWRRSPPDGRGAYFESYYGYLQYGWAPLAGWVDRTGKYVHGPTPEFFDVARDPGERHDRADETDTRPYVERIDQVAARPALAVEATVDSTLLDELASLGYATAGAFADELPHPLAPSERPDVRSRRRELQETHQAFALAERGDLGGAIRALEEIVAKNPGNISAQERLGSYLIAASRYEDALDTLQELLGLGRETGLLHNNIGHCLQNLGRNEEALVHLRRGLELDATNPMIPINLALVLRRLGRGDEAREYDELAAELRR